MFQQLLFISKKAAANIALSQAGLDQYFFIIFFLFIPAGRQAGSARADDHPTFAKLLYKYSSFQYGYGGHVIILCNFSNQINPVIKDKAGGKKTIIKPGGEQTN